jgi:5'(3')-deoxyribonucleotidase
MTTRVALDVDEVLYSWQRTARYLLRNLYNGTVMDYDLSKDFAQWVIATQIGEKAYRWLFDEGVKLGLFRHGHVITGAMLGVRALKAAGFDLVVVTHRPENAVGDTLAWLNFHFGREDPFPFAGVSILSGGEPKTSVAWDIIVDDSPANIDEAFTKGRVGVQFAAAWNGWDGATWETLPKTLERLR